MKTLEEVRAAKQKFHKQFKDVFTVVGNNLSTGIGKNASTGNYTIVANLTNNKLKNILPSTFDDIQVDVSVIGLIKIQK